MRKWTIKKQRIYWAQNEGKQYKKQRLYWVQNEGKQNKKHNRKLNS